MTQTASATDTKYAAVDCKYGGELKSIEAVDDNTVKFTLCASGRGFPVEGRLLGLCRSILRSSSRTTGGGGAALVENPIGTGPYMLDQWVKGDSIILKANPNYWGTKPPAETLVFKWNKEGAARLLDLQAGTVDGIDNPTPDDFDKIAGRQRRLQLLPREALNIFYVGFNNTKKPFDNEKVRQAIAMGIDRQRIVDNFYPKGSVVADYFTPCAIPGGCEGDPWYKFDPAAAKKLLADAGFPDGFDTDLSYRDVVRSYLPEPALVAQDIQAQLKQNLNINVKLNVMESTAFLDAAQAGQIGLHLLGWGADYPDQTNFLDYHFGKGASKQFGTGYPDIWDVLDKAASTRRSGGAQQALRPGQRPDQAARADGAGGARRLGRRRSRPTSRARTPARWATKSSASWIPPAASSWSSSRTPSRAACTAPTRPTASRCGSACRSTNRCWATRSAARMWSPGWPRSTNPMPT